MQGNLYKAFMDLMPGRPLQVGEVTVVDGDVVTVELPGGGIAKARGDAAVGQQVFFRDGVIEGVAPSLPVVLVDV